MGRTPKSPRAEQIASAERTLGVKLPAEYAAFLRGTSPSGTMLSLAAALAHETPRTDLPFPFTKRDAARILSERAAGRNVFLEPEDTVGSVLPIADGGCNDVTYLVLAGPLRGTIWSGGEPGWLPHARDDGKLCKFREWFETIADEVAPEGDATKAPQAVVIDRAAEQLNLRNMELSELPDALGEMTSVASMYLGGNALTKIDALAKVAGTLITLELGPNPLRDLPGDLCARLTRLESLDLRGTKLRTLPDDVARLPLEVLSLNDNPGLDFEQALSVVSRIPTLRSLSLQRCNLARVPDALAAFAPLERLYLNDNVISALPAQLAALELEILGATNNRIDRIPDELEPRIKTIYFGGNPGSRAEKKRFDAIRKFFVRLDG